MNRRQPDRAGVIVVRGGRIALIERHRAGRHYFVIPGGGIEDGETIEQAAAREAKEELGIEATLGALRVSILHREDEWGDYQQQYYFDATIDTDDIVLQGPELQNDESRGTYEAVWLPIGELANVKTLPQAVANLVLTNRGYWPDQLYVIDERFEPPDS